MKSPKMSNRSLRCAPIALVIAFCTADVGFGDFTPLDVAGANSTYARGINDLGEVVGSANFTPNGTNGNGVYGFTWTATGGYSLINFPGSAGISPYAINNCGQIVGVSGPFSGLGAFLLNPNGTFIPLDVPGAVSTSVADINNLGVIAGTYTNSSGYSNGYIRDTAGNYTTFDVSGAISTQVFGINDLGEIVGTFQDSPGGPSQAFLFNAGSITVFGVPGADSTLPEGVNNSGQIVGIYGENGSSNPFVLQADGTYVYPSIPGANAAYGINNSGQFVGTFQSSGTLDGYVADQGSPMIVTPAPSSWVSFSIGLLCLGTHAFLSRHNLHRAKS